MQRLEQRHIELIRQVNKYLQAPSLNPDVTKSLRKRVVRLKSCYKDCPLVYFTSAQLNSARRNYQEAVTDIENGFFHKTLDDNSNPEEKWEMPPDTAYSEDDILKLYSEDIVFFGNANKERIERAITLYKGFLSGENSNKQQIWARISTLHSRLGNMREAMVYLRKAARLQPDRPAHGDVIELAFYSTLGLILKSENEAEGHYRLDSLYNSALRLKNFPPEVRDRLLLTIGDIFSIKNRHIDAAICYRRSVEGMASSVDTDIHTEAKMKAVDSFLEAAKDCLFAADADPELAKTALELLLRVPIYRGRHPEYSRHIHSRREEAYELLAEIEPEKKAVYYQKANLETLLVGGMRLDDAMAKVRIDPFVAIPTP